MQNDINVENMVVSKATYIWSIFDFVYKNYGSCECVFHCSHTCCWLSAKYYI